MGTELTYTRVLISETVYQWHRLKDLTKIIPGLQFMTDLEHVLMPSTGYSHKDCYDWDKHWTYKTLCILFEKEYPGSNWRKNGIEAGRILINIHDTHMELVTKTIPRDTCTISLGPSRQKSLKPFPDIRLRHVPLCLKVPMKN